MKDLDKILNNLGISSYRELLTIVGGTDAKVYKIILESGECYALRVLPTSKMKQFVNEQRNLQIALSANIPVPKVHRTTEYKQLFALLMDWGAGHTVFQELIENPNNANNIGYEFGKIQAQINSITAPSLDNSTDWLSPNNEEKIVLDKIPATSFKKQLIHLDYHPLNVITDGERITAVIDWANGTIGDARFDIARTRSILRFQGMKQPDFLPTIKAFENGWRSGYENVKGPFESLESMPFFHAWSSIRMKRDLKGKLHKSDLEYLDDEASYWLRQSNLHDNPGKHI